MGEGEGGGGQYEDLLGPPSPSSPPTEGRGDLVELCLFNYGLLSNASLSRLTQVTQQTQITRKKIGQSQLTMIPSFYN